VRPIDSALAALIVAPAGSMARSRVPPVSSGARDAERTCSACQGHFWMVGVRVNPAGMVTFSFAIFAGVGGRNP
jgi:hypothetical protein